MGPSRKSETILALGRKQMAHGLGNEYQVRIIHADGTENVSGWMNSEELLQVTAMVHRAQGTAYWLRERNVLCPDCFDKEQTIILECPITDIPSPRYSHTIPIIWSQWGRRTDTDSLREQTSHSHAKGVGRRTSDWTASPSDAGRRAGAEGRDSPTGVWLAI